MQKEDVVGKYRIVNDIINGKLTEQNSHFEK